MIIITLIIALLADLFFRLTWNKMYFTIGLPILILRFPVKAKYKGIPYKYLFDEEFSNSSPWRSFRFTVIENYKIGFREQIPVLHRFYIPLMHGVLIFKNDKKQVVVIGFTNWFTLWLIVSLSLAGLGMTDFFQLQDIGSIAFIVLFSACDYLLQCYRFFEIGKFAAKLCSTKHFLNTGGV